MRSGDGYFIYEDTVSQQNMHFLIVNRYPVYTESGALSARAEAESALYEVLGTCEDGV